MLQINESLAKTKELLEKEIIDDSPLSRLKSSWLESLIACEALLDKCIRVMSCLLPPKDKEGCVMLEAKIESKLVTLKKYSTDFGKYYSVIPAMIKPEMDELYALMNEYVVL